MDDATGSTFPVTNGTATPILYNYQPSAPPAIAFAVLFALAAFGHIVYLLRLRASYFIPFALGGLAESLGYIGRALSHNRPNEMGRSCILLQNVLIHAAAPLLAATVYMMLGRIASAVSIRDHVAIVRFRFAITVFHVLVTACALIMQIIGTILPTSSGEPAAAAVGERLVLAGLLTQTVALGIFGFVAWLVKCHIKRNPTTFNVRGNNTSVDWEDHFRAMLLVTVLMLVRSGVHVAEQVDGGRSSFIASHEEFVYLFDATPMWLSMVAYLVLHPSRLISHCYRDRRRSGERIRRIIANAPV